LGDVLGKGAQRLECGRERLARRHVRVPVSLVSDELPAYCGGAQAGIHALGADLRISVTLTLNDGAAILEQGRQRVFSATLHPSG
jgi:hypothetical protein